MTITKMLLTELCCIVVMVGCVTRTEIPVQMQSHPASLEDAVRRALSPRGIHGDLLSLRIVLGTNEAISISDRPTTIDELRSLKTLDSFPRPVPDVILNSERDFKDPFVRSVVNALKECGVWRIMLGPGPRRTETTDGGHDK